MTEMRQLDKAEWERKVTRIKNYHSRYELILTDGTNTYLVAYVSGRSFRMAMTAAQNRIAELNAVTGDDDVYVEGRKSSPIPADAKWRIRYSGRTQRECYDNGVWPLIGQQTAA